jgi:hypothetical protein
MLLYVGRSFPSSFLHFILLWQTLKCHAEFHNFLLETSPRKAALISGNLCYMCVYVTSVPMNSNLRAASSVTRGPFRKWRQCKLAVVDQILSLSVSFFVFPWKRKTISTPLNSVNMSEYFNSFLYQIKKMGTWIVNTLQHKLLLYMVPSFLFLSHPNG